MGQSVQRGKQRMEEGYLALCVSILKETTVEDAFRLLNGETKRNFKHYTDEDFRKMKKMVEEGQTWIDIADAFGSKKSAINKAYNKWRKNNETG